MNRRSATETRRILAGLASLKREAPSSATGDGFRLGQRDRASRHFLPASESADRSIQAAEPTMSARMRWHQINSPLIKRAASAIRDLLVGPGITAFSDPFASLQFDAMIEGGLELEPAELWPALNLALAMDDEIQRWADDPAMCDLEGKKSWWDIQRMAVSEAIHAGSALIIKHYVEADGSSIPLRLQVVEREYLDSSRDRAPSPGVNRILNGIELDEKGREVAFWLFPHHPNDYQVVVSPQTSQRVPADRVIHLYVGERPSQTSGYTWLSAMAQPSFDRDRFLSAELQSAIKAALLSLVVHREAPGEGGLGMDDEGNELERDEIIMGSDPIAAEVGIEEKVQIVESSRPNVDAAKFFETMDFDLGAAADLSYYRLTGRYNNTSYSSARAAHLDDDQHIRPLQRWLSTALVLPIVREANRWAAISGLYRRHGLSPAGFLRAERRYQAFDCIGPGRELLDPTNEREASIAGLRSGMTTLKIECAKRGLHWVRVLRQIAIEERLVELLGLQLDLSKGEGGKTQKSTRQRQEGDDAATAKG